jgi:hypothetical protein
MDSVDAEGSTSFTEARASFRRVHEDGTVMTRAVDDGPQKRKQGTDNGSLPEEEMIR